MDTKINLRKIILASSSPRRKQLMQDAGFWIEVKAFEFVETYPEHLDVSAIAEFIANQKAEEVISTLQSDDILITADSIVVLGNKVFGKPKDASDAYRMLAFLSGKTHYVYTGVCIMDHSKKISFTGKSKVTMRDLNDGEIRWYIEQFKPYDKAGAYAVQEWIGLCKIAEIEGTYSNIMGLPTDLVYESLKHFEGAILHPLI